MNVKENSKVNNTRVEISKIIVNVFTNEVVSFEFSDRVNKEFNERLKTNKDYRQNMIAYVSKYVRGDERNKTIQLLLPEQLNNYLKDKDEASHNYHTLTSRGPVETSLIIKWINKEKGLVEFEIKQKTIVSKKEYKVGSKKIALIAKECDSLNAFIDLLSPEYELMVLDPTNENLINVLLDSFSSITAILLCNKEINLVNVLKSHQLIKEIPLGLMSSDDLSVSSLAYIEGLADVLNINENKALILRRVKNICKLRDYKTTVNELEIDSQTGLINSKFFIRKASSIIEASNEEYELTLCEILSLRMFGDKFGEGVSDIAVKYVSDKLKELLEDIVLIGRYSSDKIAILRKYSKINNPDFIPQTIRENAPVPNLVVKAGVTKVSKDEPIKDLLAHAETAISKIRNDYGKYVSFYDENMKRQEIKTLQILGSMEEALETNQFQIYYQPKHSGKDCSLCGAEALVRWVHPKYGVMAPGDFLPIFERVGFIRGLDRYVWAKVIKDMVSYRTLGFDLLPISLNLSRRDFELPDLADWAIGLVRANNLDPSLIHIEVTESSYTENKELISMHIKRLHDYGFVIELDDFGVGYSSLTTLSDMEVDILKIDKSLLDKDDPSSNKNILEYALSLAKLMGLESVVEGVETKNQLDRVISLGANYIQGYYFSKPLPKDEFEKYLRKNIK